MTPTERTLLEWFVSHTEVCVKRMTDANTNARSREIEPASVRNEVRVATQRIEQARRMLKHTDEPALVDVLPPGDYGDAGMSIREQDCKVRVTFDRRCEFIAMDVGRATQVINALIVHAKVAGRKTGRIVEVRL